MDARVLIVAIAIGVLIYLLFVKKKEGFTIASPASGPPEQCANSILGNISYTNSKTFRYKLPVDIEIVLTSTKGNVVVSVSSSMGATYSLTKGEQVVDILNLIHEREIFDLPVSLFPYETWKLKNISNKGDILSVTYGSVGEHVLQAVTETGCWITPNGYKVFI